MNNDNQFTFFCSSSLAEVSSLISLSEEIEAAPVVRRVTAGLAVVGGEGFGPKEARRVGAGKPSDTEARGRAAVDVDDLAVPVEPAGETTLFLAESGVGARLEVELDKGGLGGRDGRRVADEVDADKPVEVAGVLAEAIAGLLVVVVVVVFVPGALIVVVEVGLADAGAVLAVFLRAPVAVGFVVAVDVLVALDITGGEGFNDPTPNVPELMTLIVSKIYVNNEVNNVVGSQGKHTFLTVGVGLAVDLPVFPVETTLPVTAGFLIVVFVPSLAAFLDGPFAEVSFASFDTPGASGSAADPAPRASPSAGLPSSTGTSWPSSVCPSLFVSESTGSLLPSTCDSATSAVSMSGSSLSSCSRSS